MKNIYILATFLLLLGLLYLVSGVWGIVTITNYPVLKSIIPTMAMLVLIGSLTLVSAIGLFLKNNFVRKFWLGLSIFILGFHLLWLVSDIRHGPTVTDIVEPMVILFLVVVSWRLLRSNDIIALFLNKTEESSNKSSGDDG